MLDEIESIEEIIERYIANEEKFSKTYIHEYCAEVLKNLKQDFPNLALHGVDLSENVLSFVPKGIDIRVGSLLNIPFPDDSLDIVFTCEALEHAVYIEGAIQELARVIRSGGTLVIIDKNLENTGEMQIEAWEQWFSEDEITEILRNEVTIEAERQRLLDNLDEEEWEIFSAAKKQLD